MPVEKARVLFDAPVRAAAPELAGLDALEYDYMNGIQLFLDRIPTQAVHGHVAYLSSPWALTSINQGLRSEEHTSELQSLMRISSAVFCLKKKNTHITRLQQVIKDT